jgi:WD40 repeat protein
VEPTEIPPDAATLPAKTAFKWDQVEKVARVLSLIAIPVVLAIVGWIVQNSLSDRSVGQEYVKLSLDILKEPKDKIDPSLRDWAVDLLNENSPTKFSTEVVQALKKGQATLPAQLGAILGATSGGGSLAVSPDGQLIATGHADGTARLWHAASGNLIRSYQGHSGAVTSLAFSPDGHDLLTGSFDKTARIWDTASGKTGEPFRGHTDGIIGVAFSPDGTSFWTRSRDRTVKSWSRDGRVLTTITLRD